MNKLVTLKDSDIFTDSLVIAKGTDNEHKSVAALIKKYKAKFEKFGDFRFSDLKSTNPKGGRPTRIYFLNEPQATLLITFLDNTDIVVDFKVELVKQFYAMRQFLLEKQTQLWQDTRADSKVNKLAETDSIKLFVEYAKEQGSKNADKYYITLSKLANKAVGLDCSQRDIATAKQLNNIILIENIINNVIKAGIEKEVYYKEIYQECKNRINNFLSVAYLKVI